MVTHPFDDHIQLCLTLAFKSEYFCSAPQTPPLTVPLSRNLTRDGVYCMISPYQFYLFVQFVTFTLSSNADGQKWSSIIWWARFVRCTCKDSSCNSKSHSEPKFECLHFSVTKCIHFISGLTSQAVHHKIMFSFKVGAWVLLCVSIHWWTCANADASMQKCIRQS